MDIHRATPSPTSSVPLRRLLGALTLVAVAGFSTACAPPDRTAESETDAGSAEGASAYANPADAVGTGDSADSVIATATVQSIADVDLSGEFTLRQTGDFVRIDGTVRGLGEGKHGLHIHEGSDCRERGGHFNPTGHPHGSPDEPSGHRHVGDLGNIVAEGDSAHYERVDRVVELTGPNAVIGRVLVIHQGEDQYIPQPSGSAGTEIGCALIERKTEM